MMAYQVIHLGWTPYSTERNSKHRLQPGEITHHTSSFLHAPTDIRPSTLVHWCKYWSQSRCKEYSVLSLRSWVVDEVQLWRFSLDGGGVLSSLQCWGSASSMQKPAPRLLFWQTQGNSRNEVWLNNNWVKQTLSGCCGYIKLFCTSLQNDKLHSKWEEPQELMRPAGGEVKWREHLLETSTLQTCRDTAPRCRPATCCTCREMTATSCCSKDCQLATSFHLENWTAMLVWTHSSAPDPTHAEQQLQVQKHSL